MHIPNIFQQSDFSTTWSIVALLLTILLLDFLWLGIIQRKSWENQVHDIQKSPMTVRPAGAIIAYFMIAVAVVVFVLPLVHKDHILQDSLILGGLMGLVLYGVYDGTTYAILKDYRIDMMIGDILWGVFVVAMGTLAAAYVGHMS